MWNTMIDQTPGFQFADADKELAQALSRKYDRLERKLDIAGGFIAGGLLMAMITLVMWGLHYFTLVFVFAFIGANAAFGGIIAETLLKAKRTRWSNLRNQVLQYRHRDVIAIKGDYSYDLVAPRLGETHSLSEQFAIASFLALNFVITGDGLLQDLAKMPVSTARALSIRDHKLGLIVAAEQVFKTAAMRDILETQRGTVESEFRQELEDVRENINSERRVLQELHDGLR